MAGPRRYRLDALLGSGGFGSVYRAELLADDGFSKTVALKLLNARASASTEIVERFRDEARMLGMLNHRAIVDVHGLAWLGDRWGVVMQHVEGVSAEEMLEDGPIPEGVALEIVEEVAGALHAAWERTEQEGKPLRLLHRDLKPGNIQLTEFAEVKLLDFGVARAEFAGREAHTQGIVLGSRPYMAPERFWLEDRHASDVFALMVTFCELVTGRMAEGTASEKQPHNKWLADRLSDVRAVVSAEVFAFVEEALAFEANARPEAAELERRARRLRRKVSGPWLRDWLPERVRKRMAAREPKDDDAVGRVFTEQAPDGVERSSATFAFELDGAELKPVTSPQPDVPPPPPAPREQPPPPPPPSQPVPPPEPAAPPAEPAPRRKVTKRRNPLVGCFTVLASLVVGGVLVALLITMLGGGGMVALLSAFWPSAMREVVQDDYDEMLSKLDKLPDGENVRRAKKILAAARTDPRIGDMGLLDITSVTTTFDDIIEDGRIVDIEIQRLEAAQDSALGRGR